jgi:NlpC/P60 family putative phage cell wall peptidase
MTRSDILEEARRWLGTRWQHQAALRGIGCDCVGFVAGVAAAGGSVEAALFLATPSYRDYSRQPDPDRLTQIAAELLDPIPLPLAEPADVLLFKFSGPPQHFAFLTAINPDRIIHAYAGARKVTEHGLDALWRSRILGAYRLRGIA